MNTDGETGANNQSYLSRLWTTTKSWFSFGRNDTEKKQKEPTKEVLPEEVNPGHPNQVSQVQQVTVMKDETAFGKLKESLHSVKVSKYDADELQRKLEGELFDKWSEACEVMSAKQILFSDIEKFLDHLQDAY